MSSITWSSETPRAADEAMESLLATPLQWLLASLSAGAGIIHLVMVPSHMGESSLEGAGFAVAGLVQVTIAALLLVRPTRSALAFSILLSAGLIGGWVMSRTVGLPVGSHKWHAESVSFVDGSAVAFEVAIIALAGAALVRPAFARTWFGGDRYLAGVVSLAVLVVATAAVASPSARDHASGSHGEHGHAMDDGGFSALSNGHHHEFATYELDEATQAGLDWQLAETRNVARMYPTVADAEAAGYSRAGPYTPGLGAHYLKLGDREFNADGVVDSEDIAHPFTIIYDGTDPDSRVAGFMYYAASDAEPAGFVGPNDTWHYHQNLCVKTSGANVEVPFGPDNSATPEQCAGVGGFILEQSGWMVHVWSVPGYDDIPGGTFTEHNPDLRCADGTYYTLPVDEWAENPLDACKAR